MTILDHSLFKSITPTEVLYQNWTKQSTKHLNSPNVLSMIKQFNRVGHWVISEIVSAKELKKRLEILTRMIQVLILLFINNINFLFFIIIIIIIIIIINIIIFHYLLL